MRTLSWLLTILFFGLLYQAQAQLYTFRNFNHKDGLHMGSILSVTQSDNGYIWIGTDGTPLIRFDGNEFVEMKLKDQDSDHHIKNLEYFQDTIFFASQYKGFFAYIPEVNKYKKYKFNQSKKGDALAFIPTKNHKYLISERKIHCLEGDKLLELFSFGKSPIVLYQYIKNGPNIILLTSGGNFLLHKGKLTPLHRALNISKEEVSEYNFGHVLRNKWVLCDNKGTKWLELNTSSNNNLVVQGRTETNSNLSESEQIASYSFNPKAHKVIAITNIGQVYKVSSNKLQLVPHNYNEDIQEPQNILIDLNGDYWVASRVSGLFKISLEPFTRIQLHPIYESPNIVFPYLTMYDDFIIGLREGITKIGNFSSPDFVEFPFVVKGVAVQGNEYYVATNKGVKRFSSTDDDRKFEDLYFNNENINFILCQGDYLWVGVAGKGLHRIDIKENSSTKIKCNSSQKPDYIYTGQILDQGGKIYFGTNNGIFYCEKDQPILKMFGTPKGYGSYSGCSTKDIYGTIWFTLEKGLIGITSKEELRTIRGERYFSTNLFYTLNSDRLGNLIVGTNKGISILKIDFNGFVLGKSSYDAKSGFEGYETHMRSQFQRDNSIFVGTVEGLFVINTDILDQLKTPIKPIILPVEQHNYEESESQHSFHFKFRVNNPKSGKIFYVYRLLGSEDETWHMVKGDQLNLLNLNTGKYKLEVKATHNGNTFSKAATYTIAVPINIWQSGWMIFLVITVIIGLNFLLINYSKNVDSGALIRTKDMDVHLSMTPMLILMAAITVTTSHILGPILNDELVFNLGPLLLLGFCLVGLFFLARSVIHADKEYLLNHLLIIGAGLILLHFFYELYISEMHPFHLIGIVITCMLVPFFLHGIRSMIYFTSFLLLNGVIVVMLVDDPIYPTSFFIIALIALIVVLIFASFLRSNSLERLIFISGIINRGNIPALAFNNEGKIVYVSENISNFIDLSHDELINKDISFLNNFVPYEGTFKDVDVVKDFEDGNNYIVPMLDGGGTIHWVEWKYKDFSKDIKVMLGQEISEKMELENTYELLVQNAEDFIYRCDLDGNFLFLNDVCYERLGYEKTDLLNMDSIGIVPDKYQDEVRKFYTDHFTQRKSTSYKEFPILKKDGTVVWIGQHVTTIFAPGSNTFIYGFIALARDITELRRQQQIIKNQRDDITASINYAKRIQFNLLPHERLFTSGFKEHFLIYKPKDIVSGDFYWTETVGDTCIVALADCTGHGVPGAFMTLLGINLLNNIVKENRTLDPGKILEELDKKLIDILPRNPDDQSFNDGMEITICAIDKKSDELAFACAGSRFLIFSENTFTMFKGDNKHIGDKPPKDFRSYTTHYTELSSNDILYMFTDGVQDQFGGEQYKKFTFRRVLSMLEENAPLPLPDQRKNIEERLSDWIGNSDQTDDISILSIKKKLV